MNVEIQQHLQRGFRAAQETFANMIMRLHEEGRCRHFKSLKDRFSPGRQADRAEVPHGFTASNISHAVGLQAHKFKFR